jgi:hypothetical protein
MPLLYWTRVLMGSWSRSAGEQISSTLWNQKAQYRVHNSQLHPAECSPHHPEYFTNTHFNIILQLRLFLKSYFPFGFLTKTLHALLTVHAHAR